MLTGSFESLSPEVALRAVEESHGFPLDGTLDPYSSYVNRVYGLRREDGERLVVKFYRPGRWTGEAIQEEHRFLLDCVEAEIPVIAPLPGRNGGTLHRAGASDGEQGFFFAVFPRTGGRNFEPDGDGDLVRLGALLGRCHAVGMRRDAPSRLTCLPGSLTQSFVDELLGENLVHPGCRDDFEAVCRETLGFISPAFEGVPLTRIHGDCHRGNLIDRPGAGLVLIDFDDMIRGPAVQDLWMILPGYAADSGREIGLFLEGYEGFCGFDRSTLRLIEPLRFMRIVYFLAWRARQRNDFWFRKSFPDWGTEAFWIKETEDLRTQADVIRKNL
jgi:Ser/Thr protein kinase RdoA (MazF antagonist)